MQVSIKDITNKLTSVLAAKGYAKENIPFIVDMYLGGELRGHTSHGLASFVAFAQKETDTRADPVVIKATPALLALDARGANGNVIGKMVADEAINRARQAGVGTILVKDMDSWLRPGAIAEYIAGQDLLAVVTNSGGGTSVAPPGGYDATLGTNPIAYGIPTDGGSLVVDMATAQHAWGQVRLANKYGTPLPTDAFYDDSGHITRDGQQASAVKAFGGYKGFALSLLVEVMAGSMVGVPMMIESTTGSSFAGQLPRRGAVVTAYDPSIFIDLETFKKQNSELLAKLQASHALPEEQIRIPGVESGKRKVAAAASGNIELPDQLWHELQQLG